MATTTPPASSSAAQTGRPLVRVRQPIKVAELRPRVSRIPVFRPPGKPQPPGQVLVAPLAVVGHRVEGAAGSAVEHGSVRSDEGQVEVLVERPFSGVLELRQVHRVDVVGSFHRPGEP